MSKLKTFLADFPNQNGAVVTALVLILTTGLVVDVMLVLGKPFPDGYDTWIWALVALAGVNVVGMIGKRATDIDLARAKASAPSPMTTTTETKSETTSETKVSAPVSHDGAVG